MGIKDKIGIGCLCKLVFIWQDFIFERGGDGLSNTIEGVGETWSQLDAVSLGGETDWDFVFKGRGNCLFFMKYL
jgi:hypothetical protein